jgi:hypothetical protein
MSQPHVNCPACGDLVELTKSGKLPRHRKQRDGRRVLSVCPGSGTAIDGQSRNHGLLAEVREWDGRIEKYVDELLDGGTKP